MAFTAALFGNIVFAQTNAQITEIRNGVAAINKRVRQLSKTVKDVEGISLEGTEATYYISGRGLHKITAKIYGETYQSKAEFYYQGEQLIFIFEKFSRYKGGLGSPVASTVERRYYFSDKKMIRYLIGKTPIKSSDERFAADGDAMLETAKKLKEAYLES